MFISKYVNLTKPIIWMISVGQKYNCHLIFTHFQIRLTFFSIYFNSNRLFFPVNQVNLTCAIFLDIYVFLSWQIAFISAIEHVFIVCMHLTELYVTKHKKDVIKEIYFDSSLNVLMSKIYFLYTMPLLLDHFRRIDSKE